MTLNPEIKERWLSALRSGRYTQAQSTLKSEKGHCCIGVLVEECKDFFEDRGVPVEDIKVPLFEEGKHALLRIGDSYEDLSHQGRVAVGLDCYDQQELINLNDRCEVDDYVKQIKYIEENM